MRSSVHALQQLKSTSQFQELRLALCLKLRVLAALQCQVLQGGMILLWLGTLDVNTQPAPAKPEASCEVLAFP